VKKVVENRRCRLTRVVLWCTWLDALEHFEQAPVFAQSQTVGSGGITLASDGALQDLTAVNHRESAISTSLFLAWHPEPPP
jgi:uncharacterized protein (AIM24 family)